MTHNVNVINNAGSGVVVTVKNGGENTQIIIDMAVNKVELSSLKQGQVFKGRGGSEYILLEFTKDGDALVLRKNLLPEDMKFGDTNNFDGSDIDKYLNTSYLKELEADFGVENILEQEIDLTSLDGLDDYGKIKRKVSLLPSTAYRRCRKFIGKGMPTWWWLLDAESTPSGCDADDGLCVGPGGDVNYFWCDYVGGVRPFFILKSSIFVSLGKEQNEVHK